MSQWIPATTHAPRRLTTGQKVYLREHRLSDSSKKYCAVLAPKWSGPYKVVKPLGCTTYLVRKTTREVQMSWKQEALVDPTAETESGEAHSADSNRATLRRLFPSTTPGHQTPIRDVVENSPIGGVSARSPKKMWRKE
ncbi:hypothetical protein PR048_021417 [Dryococelus australis]|uniref:Reverse transcriptase domain-containing protein n=1 Tax=Dryococelus australis TaxID=614101 RepID=A0ABQ9GY71_9NEOP|nr:hypothetical protein PR048_021417 [Dryococelus australis]